MSSMVALVYLSSYLVAILRFLFCTRCIFSICVLEASAIGMIGYSSSGRTKALYRCNFVSVFRCINRFSLLLCILARFILSPIWLTNPVLFSFKPRNLISSLFTGILRPSTTTCYGLNFEIDNCPNLLTFVLIFHNFSYLLILSISLSVSLTNCRLSSLKFSIICVTSSAKYISVVDGPGLGMSIV